ncbi:MAG: mannose-1-phosphate guanylyltransferase/mannose-6-phosphate isomerase, partial [Desulfobacteraceae bacterium]|nr:mannose-1-phosphate guanylyltransferase/mannose-6-phosphate isomerase [Desulfobacteraceae bacterium]
MIIPVVLAGGSGTRLWPLSRELYPKQFLSLHGEKTLLQETLARVRGMEGCGKPLVICNNDHRFLVAEQLREIDAEAAILIEPVGRNTAPAVTVAALEGMAQEDDPVLLVLPADHVIEDEGAFREAVRFGISFAVDGRLITFGIVPDKPETGYGYIEKGEALSGDQAGGVVYAVDRFVEKPDLEKAREYLRSGNFFWNSGMFMFRASRFLEELEKFAPAILDCCRQAHQGKKKDLDFIRLDPGAFASCPSDSIDYAVMEKTSAAAVIPLACGWSDIGSWSALWEIGQRNEHGNVFKGNVHSEDVRNCYIEATGRLVAAIGIENQVIVETKDAILVAARDRVDR